ncbi:hypothetical protein [Salipiger abyssi]|uniref:Phosphoadenosine phosphosulfate reductase n=1 Tax=Salipiger abyssi TaxID=1250539 RepID=A0A1P8UQB2_9RHOB|nr:hypothetical protein [Salipiger abyssi]APZ51580.1 hypothetical protein Ga0080574_TMP1246 [Salipiger abyssi]
MPLPRKFRKAALTAETNGFFKDLNRHFAVHFQRGSTLVVTFDNMKSRDMPVPRFPWGMEFLERRGHSHLGIMMRRRNDWFRQSRLCDFFDELRDGGFFDRFEKVVFYGSSMGGDGALTFAAACPRARVVAFYPQTTLSPALAPWETRYRDARDRGDWDEPRYADAADTVREIGEAMVLYDPYHQLDSRHAARLTAESVTHLRCPFLGHKIPRYFAFWNILSTVTTRAIDGTLTEAEFYSLLRARRDHKSYVRHLLTRATDHGHAPLAGQALAWTGRHRPDWQLERKTRQLGLAA